MNKPEFVKQVGRHVVHFMTTAATSAVVTNAIRSTSPAAMNFPTKVLIVIGEVALSGLVSDLAAKRAVEKYDEYIGRFQPRS